MVYTNTYTLAHTLTEWLRSGNVVIITIIIINMHIRSYVHVFIVILITTTISIIVVIIIDCVIFSWIFEIREQRLKRGNEDMWILCCCHHYWFDYFFFFFLGQKYENYFIEMVSGLYAVMSPICVWHFRIFWMSLVDFFFKKVLPNFNRYLSGIYWPTLFGFFSEDQAFEF